MELVQTKGVILQGEKDKQLSRKWAKDTNQLAQRTNPEGQGPHGKFCAIRLEGTEECGRGWEGMGPTRPKAPGVQPIVGPALSCTGNSRFEPSMHSVL